ncbi:hypothetical protein CVT25_015880 [Psilocybe cyanescens]|uniref:Uncharacterized protein n=1 Tax=Psilocybe cyanescens TaxID=93625 RepID=A0A409XIK5_PSICY|nr:hypothetical protein CVT25_015880 [Psilocybe cyanescens]
MPLPPLPPVLPPLQPPPPVLPAPLPPLIAQPVVSAAQQPFSCHWPVHNLGKMDVKCANCGALHWMIECLTSSSKDLSIFGMYCFSGKIVLSKLKNPPQELDALLKNIDPQSKNFYNHIWQYNNALAMTSLEVTVDPIGLDLILVLHLYTLSYIFLILLKLSISMCHPANSGLDKTTMSILQDMLYLSHSVIHNMPMDQQHTIVLCYEHETGC